MTGLLHMRLAGFVVCARGQRLGICMGALYAIDGFDELVGIRFCLN